jgi:hypothetical protein
MSGAIPPLPQYAFMAQCSIKKAHGQLYLYLTFIYPLSKFQLLLKCAVVCALPLKAMKETKFN